MTLIDYTPDRTDVLTIEDCKGQHLENGFASIITAHDQTYIKYETCRIDEKGFLRTMDGEYIPRHWEIKGVDE